METYNEVWVQDQSEERINEFSGIARKIGWFGRVILYCYIGTDLYEDWYGFIALKIGWFGRVWC